MVSSSYFDGWKRCCIMYVWWKCEVVDNMWGIVNMVRMECVSEGVFVECCW